MMPKWQLDVLLIANRFFLFSHRSDWKTLFQMSYISMVAVRRRNRLAWRYAHWCIYVFEGVTSLWDERCVSGSADQSGVFHEVYKSGPQLEENAVQKAKRGVRGQDQRGYKVSTVANSNGGHLSWTVAALESNCSDCPQARALQGALHRPPVHWGSGEERDWRSGNLQDLRGGHGHPGPQISIRHK